MLKYTDMWKAANPHINKTGTSECLVFLHEKQLKLLIHYQDSWSSKRLTIQLYSKYFLIPFESSTVNFDLKKTVRMPHHCCGYCNEDTAVQL